MGLVSQIHEVVKIQPKIQLENGPKKYGQTFQRKGYTVGKQALEKTSSSLTVREMQIKTTVERHYAPRA